MKRKIYNSNNDNAEVLCVPWYPQQEHSYYCFPYSLWMVIQFYKNVYTNNLIKKNTPNLDIEELARLCKTDPRAGTRINDQLVNSLNKAIPTLNFELVNAFDFKQLKKIVVDNQCPCIVIYDCGYFLYGIESQVGHAGVVIGLDDTSIYLNNPWLGAEKEIDKVKFNDCWEIEYNQVLLIKPRLQTDLNEDSFNKNASETSN